MILFDELYGEYEITEEVLIELIRSKEVQRLKDIHMAGPAYLLNPLWNETRYEHSIGVMLLIRKLNGSVEEQIAGLLHDVSHTAFSHLIDLVKERKNENFHEEIRMDYLKESSLPAILSNYGYDFKELLEDDAQWEILEQSAPLLCADRLDYTLREVHRYFQVPLQEIHTFLGSLKVLDHQLVLDDLVWGEWFIEQYNKIVIDFFYDPLNIFSSHIMKKAIHCALEQKSITESDFLQTDKELLEQLNVIQDKEVQQLLGLLNVPPCLKVTSAEEGFDIFHQTKARTVDPLVLFSGQICQTSEKSVKAKIRIQQAVRRGQEGLHMKIL